MTASDAVALPDSSQSFLADSLPPIEGAWERADLQRIWLGTQRRAWRTLAVVPADAGISTYEVAGLLAALGRHHGELVVLADLREIGLNRVSAFLAAARELVEGGQRVIFAARAISENLATIPLARAADGVVLCVCIGATRIRSIEDAVEQIGREQFLGSMLVPETASGARDPFLTLTSRSVQAGS